MARPNPKIASNVRFIMGRHCIEELLAFAPERLHEVIIVSRDPREGHATRLDDLVEHLKKHRVRYRFAAPQVLTTLVGSDSHQGVVAQVTARAEKSLSDLLAHEEGKAHSRLVVLDGVIDPHNTGAILRAAECFGVSGVIWSWNRGAPITPVVAKVSVGASEIVPIVTVANVRQAILQCRKAGYWLVGASLGDGSISLDTFSFPERCALVLGSEGQGLHRLVEETLDFRVAIPMLGRIDSLNVSQASAIMLREMARQHGSQSTPVDKEGRLK